MNSPISELIINHHSGAEIEFDRDSKAINVILSDGSLATYKKGDIEDIFWETTIAYNLFDSCCILVGETGTKVIAVYFDQPLIKHLCDIERTELLNEGFDYCFFFNFKNRVVLTYEHGLIGFDLDGRIAWHHEFPASRTLPQIVNEEILFTEIDREYRYTISDGKMIN